MARQKLLLGAGLFVLILIMVFASTGYKGSDLVVQPGTTPGQTQQGAPQGKINIDAVCQGALAYMTFPDAASAEVFVQECTEGKHPEVIEQYKAQMGLGEGAAI